MARPQRQDRDELEPNGLAARSERHAVGFPLQVALPYGGRVIASGKPGLLLEEELVRIRPALERYLRARGAADQAEDLVQELWIKVSALSADTEVSDPTSYLYRMAHNLMLDRRRTDLRRNAREHLYARLGDDQLDGVDPAPMPERVIDGRRSLEAVQRLLRSLGERTDHIFRRHWVEGVSQREIAIELGITLSAVEKHLQKAYKAIHAIRGQGGERGAS